jgi:hypothetical protein
MGAATPRSANNLHSLAGSCCRRAGGHSRITAQRCKCPGWYRGSQNSWLLAARGGGSGSQRSLAALGPPCPASSLCAASLGVVDGYSTLSLALHRSNVVIPRRAAAGPLCRTARAVRTAEQRTRRVCLRCCSVQESCLEAAAERYDDTARPSARCSAKARARGRARHGACVDSVLCFDMPLSAQFIGDISLIPKRAGNPCSSIPEATSKLPASGQQPAASSQQRISSVLRPLSLEAPPLCFSPLPGALAAASLPCSVMHFAALASDLTALLHSSPIHLVQACDPWFTEA